MGASSSLAPQGYGVSPPRLEAYAALPHPGSSEGTDCERRVLSPLFPTLPGTGGWPSPVPWAYLPSPAPGPLVHMPLVSCPLSAAGLTCQRLRARRNLSCLVLMKCASSAGRDFWRPG